ncbi:MAG: pyruvate kinase [Alphaproteobacteria bacterium]|nr:pyruvate kinase [Alphaproteobacteria bacterium]
MSHAGPARPVHRERATKIVATLGPASNTKDAIRDLFMAGADVFRFNFSHGTHDDHRRRMEIVRGLESELNRPICALADLQGPKLRVGAFAKGAIDLKPGQSFRFDLEHKPGDENRVCLPHPEIFAAVGAGSDILCDDGRVRLRVTSVGRDHMVTEVISGTRLSDHKGVNVPGVVLPLSAMTDKDKRDLDAALAMGADWVALSFVQRPEDVAGIKKLVAGRAAVLAKLEKPSAVKTLERILELADGVMVARGDLGVELPPEDVPSIQKQIVREARKLGKPVIVATQMLESMIASPAPTRAEASDVATAIYDGADAIMLSGETAMGKYPVEAVAIMDRIARRIHTDPIYRDMMDSQHPDLQHTAADAITAAARQVVETIDAAAIVTYTTHGATTLRAARERPHVPILCLTSKLETARRLALSFGVHAVHTEDVHDFAEMVQKASHVAQHDGIAEVGQRLVVTAGVPFGTPGNTNILRIAWVENQLL